MSIAHHHCSSKDAHHGHGTLSFARILMKYPPHHNHSPSYCCLSVGSQIVRLCSSWFISGVNLIFIFNVIFNVIFPFLFPFIFLVPVCFLSHSHLLFISRVVIIFLVLFMLIFIFEWIFVFIFGIIFIFLSKIFIYPFKIFLFIFLTFVFIFISTLTTFP